MFFSPEEKEARYQLIMHATPEGLTELLNVFEQAFSKQKSYLQTICENDPKFARNFYMIIKKGETETKTKKELKGVKKNIKQKNAGSRK